MKHTPFLDMHKAYGGKLVAFAGFELPVSFKGIREEHESVRKNAGVFDVSHMGEFMVKGPNAMELIQRLTCNDISKVKAGKAQYSCLINDQGGIIDDLLIYCLEENAAYMLVVNAANIEKDWNWIVSHNTAKAELKNISDRICQLAIQGPKAVQLIAGLTEVDLVNMKYFTFEQGTFAGVENVLISATGYTGAGGVEIYFENKADHAEKVWDAIFKNKAENGIEPIGLGARDTLRLEMGYCLYGNDIDDTTSPLEAGLGWITKLKSKGDFTGKAILENQKAEGVQRKLVGFEMQERGIPRHGYTIFDAAGKDIGKVTSGTQSPSLGKAIGMGYVATEKAELGTEIFIEIRNRNLKAAVCKMPFE